jgi:hypothetical protein
MPPPLRNDPYFTTVQATSSCVRCLLPLLIESQGEEASRILFDSNSESKTKTFISFYLSTHRRGKIALLNEKLNKVLPALHAIIRLHTPFSSSTEYFSFILPLVNFVCFCACRSRSYGQSLTIIYIWSLAITTNCLSSLLSSWREALPFAKLPPPLLHL